MEPFDVAVAFRAMLGRTAMGDTAQSERFRKPGRSELHAVVGGQCYARPLESSRDRRHTLSSGFACVNGSIRGKST